MTFLKNINFLSVLFSVGFFFISFLVSELQFISFPEKDKLLSHFLSSGLNSFIVLLLQWLIWHVIFWKRCVIYHKIERIFHNTPKLIGISQRENAKNPNLSILSQDNYKLVESQIKNYNEWEFPILNFSFKSIFWLSIKPRLTYTQQTRTSTSWARDSIFSWDNQNRVFHISLRFANRVNHLVPEMRNKRGTLVLEYSPKKESIVYMKYSREDSDKAFGGFIFLGK